MTEFTHAEESYGFRDSQAVFCLSFKHLSWRLVWCDSFALNHCYVSNSIRFWCWWKPIPAATEINSRVLRSSACKNNWLRNRCGSSYFYINILCRDESTSQNTNAKFKPKLPPISPTWGIVNLLGSLLKLSDKVQVCVPTYSNMKLSKTKSGGLSIWDSPVFWKYFSDSAWSTKWVNLNIHRACSEMTSPVYTKCWWL